MSQTSISVWFVCKLCRGSFRQVDDFIEHKNEKHFNEFQNTSCIVFEETESNLCPFMIKAENQLTDKTIELPTKIQVTDDDPIFPVSFEIIRGPEPKSELINYESEINPDSERSFFGLKQPKQNPYELLKQLALEDIQRACSSKQHSRLLRCEPQNFANDSKSNKSSEVDSVNVDPLEVKKCIEIQPTATSLNISTEHDVQFECKLCSKQLQSDAHLKIHVGICSLYHEDRNRYCVACNQKFPHPQKLKLHRVSFHGDGTEEEKSLLFNFKCHVCPKQYHRALDLRFHLESHKEKKQQSITSRAKSFKCLQPNCGKEFNNIPNLRRHNATAHLGVRLLSCPYRSCYKKFSQNAHLKRHLLIHTGERPYKCPVDNCSKSFRTPNERSRHHQFCNAYNETI